MLQGTLFLLLKMAEFQALCHAAGYIWNSSDAVSSLPVLVLWTKCKIGCRDLLSICHFKTIVEVFFFSFTVFFYFNMLQSCEI